MNNQITSPFPKDSHVLFHYNTDNSDKMYDTTQAAEILKAKKLFIFDMDGTIYLGEKVFEFSVSFIKNLRKSGKNILFFTNNASHDPAFYLDRLCRMGFEATSNEIMTSADVTINFLKRHRSGKTVFLVGTPELCRQFKREGITLSEKADIVITSFDTTLNYEKLNTACKLVREGAEYFSTHPDFNCPTEDGFIPDSGAISAFVTASTGIEPEYFGKPYKMTIDMISEMSGYQRADMCIFGDRLYTDIALGRRHGVTSVLVLSGETKKVDVSKAHPEDRPDFIFPTLKEVNDVLF